MLSHVSLETRLSQVEQELAQIKQQLGQSSAEKVKFKNAWLEKVVGSITNDEAFLEALEYGRAFRQSEMLNDSQG
jgi:hypothetical protein